MELPQTLSVPIDRPPAGDLDPRTIHRISPAGDVREGEGPPESYAVYVEGLTRRYGASRALDNLDLSVPWDQRLALLGPNGAGKTTLLRILATIARPTSGRVLIGGLSLADQASAIRRHVGIVAHQTFLYDDLTVRENLAFYGKLYGVSRIGERVAELLDLVGLGRRADDRVHSLSRGLQQRAALARAIVHDPPILLLDEPDTGLDVDGVDLVGRIMIDDSGRSRTVVLTTHNLERALDLSDRVVVLVDGKLAYDHPAPDTSLATLISAIRRDRAMT